MNQHNIALARRRFDKYNSRHHARVTRRLVEAGILADVARVVASYTNDDELFARVRRNMLDGLSSANGQNIRNFADEIRAAADHEIRSRIMFIVLGIRRSPPLMWMIGDCFVVTASFTDDGDVAPVDKKDVNDPQYNIDFNAAAPKEPGFASMGIIRMYGVCGGRFDEHGNLWV